MTFLISLNSKITPSKVTLTASRDSVGKFLFNATKYNNHALISGYFVLTEDTSAGTLFEMDSISVPAHNYGITVSSSGVPNILLFTSNQMRANLDIKAGTYYVDVVVNVS